MGKDLAMCLEQCRWLVLHSRSMQIISQKVGFYVAEDLVLILFFDSSKMHSVLVVPHQI